MTRPLTGTRIVEVPNKENLPKQYEPGRRCSEPSCGTVLTTWNKGPACYAHQSQRRMFSRTEELRELMAA